MAAAAAIVILIGVAASLRPALRASRIDPAVALRPD
jgi:ABC-type antimicrobial peptide transport system permease subunit